MDLQTNQYNKIYDFENWNVFIFFILLYLLISFYVDQFIITRSIFQNTFHAQLSYSGIDQLISIKKRWYWIKFAIIPILLFIKINFTSACLAIGCYLSDLKLSFKDLFRIALVAEISLALGLVVRIIWLTFKPLNTFTEIQNFSPLSLAWFIGSRSIPKYLLYLCQTINVFEIAYWVVLAAGLVAFLQKPFVGMFKLVMSSYGIGLLLWIIFVSYLTITLSP